jgi:hypothetical protein
MNSWKQKLVVAWSVAMAVCSGSVFASLPDTGCDVDSLITSGITAMGAVAAVAVGGYVAFKVVKKALGWVGRAMG